MKVDPDARWLTFVAIALFAMGFVVEMGERYGFLQEPRVRYHQTLFWSGLVAASAAGSLRSHERRIAALEGRLADKKPVD